MSVIDILIYSIIIYFIYKLFNFSFRVHKVVKSGNFYHTESKENVNKKEGQTTIQYVPEKESIKSKDPDHSDKEKDYIDFEELKSIDN